MTRVRTWVVCYHIPPELCPTCGDGDRGGMFRAALFATKQKAEAFARQRQRIKPEWRYEVINVCMCHLWEKCPKEHKPGVN